jgi:hypothetical protein
MSVFYRCKFFYLQEINFSVKGELPSYACEKGHDISVECTKSCPDFQKVKKTINTLVGI